MTRQTNFLIVLALAAVAAAGGLLLLGDNGVATRLADDRATPATGLQPGLIAAFQRAERRAAAVGEQLTVTSGYRTAAHQRRLLREEIARRGSREEALRWVFTPERSMHVQGLAIDVGDRSAAAWLDTNGAQFGLCRTLDWEWWHFEWRPGWEADRACPDPVHDPADAPGG